ncbi:integrin alpha-4 [Patella vulgata]|uniref:integrin alpha-4 n=1 Tax=Patella vulgata TaxID=6465 RepID=UPI00217F25DE|nr:integrin alpha-4 [Patella vulgata]
MDRHTGNGYVGVIKSHAVIYSWICYLLLCYVIPSFSCFNIDIEHPVIFQGPPGSLFGYSVGIVPTSDSAWILVGAPQANDSNLAEIKRPGALYKCSTEYTNHCEIVEIHSQGNIKQTVQKWKNITLHHSKQDQWLGASLDVNIDGDDSVVVCAPRWRDREYYVQGHEFMNGLCYESNSDLKFTETSVWPALEFYKKQIHSTGVYVYGMGTLGTSVTYSKDGRYLLMGAPGINDWAGGFAIVSGRYDARPKIVQPERLLYNNSYLGYSITTARLSADGIFTVIGGPRADNQGKIMVYNDNNRIMLTKDGEQFGSYYGASVISVDLNGDSLDDLVVGAPLFTELYDEGRVYVYINKEFFDMEPTPAPLKGSNSPAARFGTTLANIKDLNNDGFEDIAVGAPFEETSGVVYIYNGKLSGIHQEYSQRIVGSDLKPSLLGFGWSISRPHDVDGNFYSDFVVGAYGSDNAVLLAARPVIDLRSRLDINPRVIDPDGTPNCLYRGAPAQCLKAMACFIYDGNNLPKTQTVSFTLRLDTLPRHRQERQRLFVRDRYGDETEVLKDTISLRVGSWNCGQSYTVYTKKSRDIVTPLQFDLNHTLAHDKLAPPCHICPIVNPYSFSEMSATAHFWKDCGSDDACEADLVLSTDVIYKNNGKYLILDESPSFEVQVGLYNVAELAYFTVVRFRYPKDVRYGRVKTIVGNSEIICLSKKDNLDNSTDMMECDISHPLRSREEIIFTVRFITEQYSFNLDEFNITVEAETASTDLNLRNNQKLATIQARVEASLSLTGAAIPAQLQLDKKVEDDEGDWLEMKQVFDVRNHGPSPFPHGFLILLAPNSQYISVKDVQIRSEDEEYSIGTGCTMVWTPSIDKPRASFKLTKYSSNDDQTDYVKERELICSPEECLNITCYIDTLGKNNGVYLTITFELKKSIMQDLKVQEQLRFISSVTLLEPDFPTYISLTQNNVLNATTFILPVKIIRKPFQIWILAVSIVSGLLLLYLVGLLLWKCGFFRRKKKEELQKLIRETETERIANITSHPVSDVNDVMILPAPNNIFLSDVMTSDTTTFTHENNHNNHWRSTPAYNNDTYLHPIGLNNVT